MYNMTSTRTISSAESIADIQGGSGGFSTDAKLASGSVLQSQVCCPRWALSFCACRFGSARRLSTTKSSRTLVANPNLEEMNVARREITPRLELELQTYVHQRASQLRWTVHWRQRTMAVFSKRRRALKKSLQRANYLLWFQERKKCSRWKVTQRPRLRSACSRKPPMSDKCLR